MDNNEKVTTPQKPISLIISDFKKNIIDTINNSGLPLSIVEFIMKDLYSEIHIAAEQQSMKEKEAWENAVKDNK